MTLIMYKEVLDCIKLLFYLVGGNFTIIHINQAIVSHKIMYEKYYELLIDHFGFSQRGLRFQS